ncbi:MAG: YlmC/YmxH family sporulation protein [Ruminococcaceae bacterium]|nr:YlmC/YmxH family sporulation protein [Oscillospiraceae bacterium]
MFRASDFKCKEVINLITGERLGFVCDLEIDECSGKILALILPQKGKISIFSKNDRIVIPWDCITKISCDIILVKLII